MNDGKELKVAVNNRVFDYRGHRERVYFHDKKTGVHHSIPYIIFFNKQTNHELVFEEDLLHYNKISRWMEGEYSEEELQGLVKRGIIKEKHKSFLCNFSFNKSVIVDCYDVKLGIDLNEEWLLETLLKGTGKYELDIWNGTNVEEGLFKHLPSKYSDVYLIRETETDKIVAQIYWSDVIEQYFIEWADGALLSSHSFIGFLKEYVFKYEYCNGVSKL